MFLLNVNKICLNTISLIRKLRFSIPLKKEHKILNLDDAEDDKLIQTIDKDKTIYSIAAIWNVSQWVRFSIPIFWRCIILKQQDLRKLY